MAEKTSGNLKQVHLQGYLLMVEEKGRGDQNEWGDAMKQRWITAAGRSAVVLAILGTTMARGQQPPAPQAKAKGQDAPGWGTVQGQIQWQGPLPQPRVIRDRNGQVVNANAEW